MTRGDANDPIQLAHGRVLILNRDDGVYGVTWLPDEGYGPPEHTYTNRDSMLPGDFPQEYDTGKLLAFAYRHYDV